MKTLLSPEKWVLDLYPYICSNSELKKLSNYIITAQLKKNITTFYQIKN